MFTIKFYFIYTILWYFIVYAESTSKVSITNDQNFGIFNVFKRISLDSFNFFKHFRGKRFCEGLQCKFCLFYNSSYDDHQACMIAAVYPGKVGAYLNFTFDGSQISTEGKQSFQKMCIALMHPAEKVQVCLQCYNFTYLSLFKDVIICMRMELVIGSPVINIDLNCIEYKSGKGIFLDTSMHLNSTALLNLHFNNGQPVLTLPHPLMSLAENIIKIKKKLLDSK